MFFLKNWKILACIGLLVGAFFTGWQVNQWRIESNQADAYREAVDKATADLQAKLNTERQKSVTLSGKLTALETRNTELIEEIAHADYQAPAPVSGVCPAHPINDPDWLRDYNRAARLADPDTG